MYNHCILIKNHQRLQITPFPTNPVLPHHPPPPRKRKQKQREILQRKVRICYLILVQVYGTYLQQVVHSKHVHVMFCFSSLYMRVFFKICKTRVLSILFNQKNAVNPSCIIIFLKLIVFTLLLDVWLSFPPLGSSFIPENYINICEDIVFLYLVPADW